MLSVVGRRNGRNEDVRSNPRRYFGSQQCPKLQPRVEVDRVKERQRDRFRYYITYVVFALRLDVYVWGSS